MRRIAVLVTSVVLVGVMLEAAAAQDAQAPNPLDVLIDAFNTPAGEEFAAGFVIGAAPESVGVPDPEGDFEHSTGQDPGYTPDHIDILETSTVELQAGPLQDRLFGPTDENGVWAATGVLEVDPPSYEPFLTYTGEGPQDGGQFDEGGLLFGFDLGSTPMPPLAGRCEYVVWMNDASRGATFANLEAFPRDPAAGTNVAFGLGINPEADGVSTTFALELVKGEGFVNAPSIDVRSFVTPSFVGVLVPTSEIGEMAEVNFYAFCAEQGITFAPDESGSDQTEPYEISSDGLVLVQVTEVAAPTTTTTSIETPSTLGQGNATAEDADTAERSAAFPWWLVLIAVGLGSAGLGWWLFNSEQDPSAKALANLKKAQKACDTALLQADLAADECEEADLAIEDLSQERKDVCRAWPPACWDTEEGSWVEDGAGNRITSRDVHMRKKALGEAWDSYRAGDLTAVQIEEKWKVIDTVEFRAEMAETDRLFRNLIGEIDNDIALATERAETACNKASKAQEAADEACEAVETARLEYERSATEVSAEATAAPSDVTDSAVPGPTAAAASIERAAGPEPCETGARRYEIAGDSETFPLDVDFAVIVDVADGEEGQVPDGRELTLTLSDLAKDLGIGGEMLDARAAGLHVKGAVNGYSQGKYVVTRDGVIRGGIEAMESEAGATPETPTSTGRAVTEGLEAMTRIGATVSSRVVEWMDQGQLMKVRLTMFHQQIVATPFRILECRDGSNWECVDEVWEIQTGKLRRRPGRDRVYDISTKIRLQEFEQAVEDLGNRGANNVRRAAEALARWRPDHEPGPC